MTTRIASSVLGLFVIAGVASADVIPIAGDIGNSTEQTGATFSGTLDYTFTGADMGTLIVSLSNDTPALVGGFLTGFVFNILSMDDNASASLLSATNANFLDTGPESAPPFGDFDAGAALGADWTGGGSPNGGMGVGDFDVFTFKVTASDASALSAISFIGSGDDINFAVRFRGLTDGGSDKVPGVPAPGAGALALGALGLATRRRR